MIIALERQIVKVHRIALFLKCHIGLAEGDAFGHEVFHVQHGGGGYGELLGRVPDYEIGIRAN